MSSQNPPQQLSIQGLTRLGRCPDSHWVPPTTPTESLARGRKIYDYVKDAISADAIAKYDLNDRRDIGVIGALFIMLRMKGPLTEQKVLDVESRVDAIFITRSIQDADDRMKRVEEQWKADCETRANS